MLCTTVCQAIKNWIYFIRNYYAHMLFQNVLSKMVAQKCYHYVMKIVLPFISNFATTIGFYLKRNVIEACHSKPEAIFVYPIASLFLDTIAHRKIQRVHGLVWPKSIQMTLHVSDFRFQTTILTSTFNHFCYVNSIVDDCRMGNGQYYMGQVNVTKSGISCQKWDSQKPHTHIQPPNVFPQVQNAENYCRNAGGEEPSPWCYTMNESVRWQLCDIPLCRKSLYPFHLKYSVFFHSSYFELFLNLLNLCSEFNRFISYKYATDFDESNIRSVYRIYAGRNWICSYSFVAFVGLIVLQSLTL